MSFSVKPLPLALLAAFAASASVAAQPAPSAAADVSTLSPVVVQGSSDASPTSGADYVATRSRSGTKSDAALIDTPQTINVITRNEMDWRGVTSLAQAVRYTPGVFAQYGDNDVRYDWLTIRGFTPARYLDGLLLPFGARGYAQPRIDTYGLERIEILKGPSSGLYGQSAPGGLVNMTSKRPTAEPINEVVLQAGSFNRYQGSFDFSGPADDEGKFLYRLTGTLRDSDTQYQHVDDERQFIAPSFTWRPSSDTSLNLNVQYQKITSHGGGGAPVLPVIGTLEKSSAGYIPRDRFVGEPGYDIFTNEQTMVGYTLDHRLNDTWSVRQSARYTNVDTNTRRVQIGAMASETQAIRYAWAFPETAHAFQIDNQVNAKFTAGPTRHDLTFGLDYLREKSRYNESSLGLMLPPASPLFDVFNPDYGTPVTRPPTATKINMTRNQLGVYAQDQIELDRLLFTLVGRYDWTEGTTDTGARGSAGQWAWTSREADANRFTGRLGVTYRFDNGLAPYLSYSTSFQPVTGVLRDGSPLKPTTGEQYEAGIKFQPNGYASFVTLSAFQINQNNVSTPDPVNTSFVVQTGQVQVQGLELEGKASFDNGLDLTMSYALSDSEITKSNNPAQRGNQLNFVPRHQAALWADYTLRDGPLQGVGLGAGVTYRGGFYGDLNNNYAIPAVTLVDAAIRYDLGRASPTFAGAQVALNVSNLFDKRYVANCLGTAVSCYWGAERTVMATLRYRW
ncbi:TonB-dependent siderophore receptor [Achromobacter insolitus]|uniref:TonB-dependent siderophore receptor n=1 Tax=Achromobacter insolitus TaxID=217204 RepID=UPI00174A0303|nr:TonB-dependent siderophore receptor [Achromobacter insolitus]